MHHRYVHGGFTGTEARFSFYLPPEGRYEGRFFQPLHAIVGNEHLADGSTVIAKLNVGFAVASGGYLVESNQGWSATNREPAQSAIHGYRASAAAAHYSRVVAADMYGDHRPYGYCSGGSAGGWRTISCLENSDAWDGGVPLIHPHPATFPTMLSADAHAIRLLRHKVSTIVDALEPGGTGNMFDGLTIPEREALARVTRLGFPPRALFALEDTARIHAGFWAGFADRMIEYDPGYFDDFWTVPGYLGADFPDALSRARIQQKTTVKSVLLARDAATAGIPTPLSSGFGSPDDPIALVLSALPRNPDLQGATLTCSRRKGLGARPVYSRFRRRHRRRQRCRE